jgi:hypothetical protein
MLAEARESRQVVATRLAMLCFLNAFCKLLVFRNQTPLYKVIFNASCLSACLLLCPAELHEARH